MQFLLDDLNAAQCEAVTHPQGPMLVIAGAGSGKTRVITRRIAWLLHKGLPEWSVLGVTFTNKAAREMAARVHELVPDSRIRLSTFHSACASWLRRSGELLGFSRDFTIYDTQDRDQLIKQLMRERDMPIKELRPSRIGHKISSLKNQGVLPQAWEHNDYDVLERYVARIYAPYQAALASMNAMDFDDLLLHFLRLVDEFPEERQRYASRYRHVLVDEFQDTNAIQYRIVKRLSEEHGNLCVVGDPDQSIYSFRGAEIGNILRFPDDYQGVKVVKLETNYRSTETILAFAQKVIDHNSLRFDKKLIAGKGAGQPVAVVSADDARHEARDVAYQVRKLIENGTSPQEIAVFYRARFLSRALEEAFRALNLPHELVGDVGFFGRKEIKDLLAFLQVTVNPRDTVSLARILNVPPRGIGKVSQQRFYGAAEERELGPGELLLEGVQGLADIAGISKKAVKGLAELGGLITQAQLVAETSVEAALQVFVEKSGYIEATCRTGSYQDVDREENVHELLLNAKRFDEDFETRSDEREHALATYLQEVSLFQESVQSRSDEERVQLMTVHASKGLEFDHVFVVGCEEQVFPHRRSEDDKHALEEERRLFYVAATRARASLTLLRACHREAYGQGWQANPASRFLEEGGVESSAARRRSSGGSSAGPEMEDGEPVFRVDRGAPDDDEESAASGGSNSFEVGERVLHPSYGDGKILKTYGSGINTKAEVIFASGIRTLLLEYAKLEHYGEI